jgi:hypothetical protein
MSSNPLEEYVASIFMAKEEAKQETSTKQAASRAGSLLGLLFSPEDGADIFLQNEG